MLSSEKNYLKNKIKFISGPISNNYGDTFDI